MSKELFKEAIADAKAVREAALANAKAALEEALTPKLQSMLAAKLQEMELNEEDETMEEVKKKSEDETMEEGMYPDVTGDAIQEQYDEGKLEQKERKKSLKKLKSEIISLTSPDYFDKRDHISKKINGH